MQLHYETDASVPPSKLGSNDPPSAGLEGLVRGAGCRAKLPWPASPQFKNEGLTGPEVPATVLEGAAPCALVEHWARLSMPSKHRVSLNLTPDEYREIAALAEHARVSKAWIGRQALLEFLERYRNRQLQLPLDLAGTSRQADRP